MSQRIIAVNTHTTDAFVSISKIGLTPFVYFSQRIFKYSIS